MATGLPSSENEVVLLHNPRCSKSRAALALLQERGTAHRVRLYLEDPLSREELAQLRERLGRPAAAWLRKGEQAFADGGLSLDLPEEKLLDAMAAHPILMERPILVRGAQARVGRPPEDILEIL